MRPCLERLSHTRMIRIRRVVVFALLVAGAVVSWGASDRPKEIVTLPAFKVYADWITVNYYQGEDGFVTHVLIQTVTPNSPAARAGLRKRDELIAIDDVKVAGMSDEQFIEAYAGELPQSGRRDFDFRCYRGLFRTREQIVRFRLTRDALDSTNANTTHE